MCHLTCPETDFINKTMQGESFSQPLRFNSVPEIKEPIFAGYMPATFILAPLAMKLREDGVRDQIIHTMGLSTRLGGTRESVEASRIADAQCSLALLW